MLDFQGSHYLSSVFTATIKSADFKFIINYPSSDERIYIKIPTS